VNRWADPAWRARRDDLIGALEDHRPEPRKPRLSLGAPV